MKKKRIDANDLFEDYLGNPIHVGDEVLRAVHSTFEKREIVHMTPGAIHLKRYEGDAKHYRWDQNTNKYEVVVHTKPLKVAAYRHKKQFHIINLSKLNLKCN